MINFRKVSSFIFSMVAVAFAAISPAFAVGKYAKVVFLGGDGTGKTSLVYTFTSGKKAPAIVKHSDNLNVRERFYEFDEGEKHYSVNTKLWDTSGEILHKSLIEDFCTNATVAIIIFDLPEFSHHQVSIDEINMLTWEWVDTLFKINPDCRLVFVGTKRDMVGVGMAMDQAKSNIRRIANFDSIKGRVGDRIMYVSAIKDDPRTICEGLGRLISDAIKDYGLAKLPNRPTSMSARIVATTPTKTEKRTVRGSVVTTVPRVIHKKVGGPIFGGYEWVQDGTEGKRVDYTCEYEVEVPDPSQIKFKLEYNGEF